ncbi:helix-turn-helix transcriptional regulator [Microbacterium sp.]|uniref:helix-turn-helix transcriptional regulator n=1 Tax=Microbacterium sp. TaxID=51671 RepID=UPI003F7089AF
MIPTPSDSRNEPLSCGAPANADPPDPYREPPIKLDRLMDVRETAAALHRTERSLRWMVREGTAPKSALIGGRRLFRESDVRTFVNVAFEER